MRVPAWATAAVVGAVILGAGLPGRSWGAAPDLSAALDAVRQVGQEGQGAAAARTAWQRIAQAGSGDLPVILGAMTDAGPLATNYLRAAVDAIVQRERQQGKELSLEMLRTFYDDSSHAPKARRTAYELMLQIDPALEAEIVPRALNDASLEMRHDAVEHALAAAEQLARQDDKSAALAAYRRAFDAARDLQQVEAAAKQIEALGGTANLTEHFGFLVNWHLIGPFDNVGTRGFDVAYGPEEKVDLQATYQGQQGPVQWQAHTTSDKLGVVDLNDALGKFKGAIAYAYAELDADEARSVEFRLGCINGNKLWVNGELVLSNHVYHAGMEVDQYSGSVPLRKGQNTVLLKIAQNEQTESWAQDWKFQLRVCDALGTAIMSTTSD